MEAIDKQGLFYLGKQVDLKNGKILDDPVLYPSKDLTTHAVCIGMTGSGKTGLGIALLEEAAIDGVPALIIDPKGDMSNLLLAFPKLSANDFLPWVDATEAEKQGLPVEKYAAEVASEWKEGIENWGQSPERIETFKKAVEFTVYTPASQAGVPLSILSSFAAPPSELIDDVEAFRERIMSTVSGLLDLLGVDSDPINSRPHILLSTLLDKAWREQRNLDLPTLIQQIQNPPLDKIGVFPVNTFFPARNRLEFSKKLNNLLASPGFQSWTQGAPLDIEQMLRTKDGRPRHAVIAISHLSDKERMFFVTLLLNEVIAWMRRQSGTSNLRSLLYMDEIFGFFPPTSMPPSKIPMLLLLKQARAFGLGIVLATQNPVDLDYKGLANCGTWFIGKLQTERDKARVIEGLKTTVSGESKGASLNDLLDACKKRVFLLHSIYQPAPYLFTTRWTLSYLRGPLTLANIRSLMHNGSTEPPINTPDNSPSIPSGFPGKGPLLPNIPQYYKEAEVFKPNGKFIPTLIAFAKLHFVDAKADTDSWQDRILTFPLDQGGQQPEWEKVKDFSGEQEDLTKDEPKDAHYASVPECFAEEQSFKALNKTVISFIYQNQTAEILSAPELKLFSRPEESEDDFRKRLDPMLQEKLSASTTKTSQEYETKLKILQEKIRKAQLKKEKGEQQLFSQRLSSWLSFATTFIGALIGALFGKKRISQSTISQTGTSIRRVSRIGKDQQDLSQVEASLEDLQKQYKELEQSRDEALEVIRNQMDSSKLSLEKVLIRPRKSDITLSTLGLLWQRIE